MILILEERRKKEKNKLFKIIHILKNIIVVEYERGNILELEYTNASSRRPAHSEQRETQKKFLYEKKSFCGATNNGETEH